MAVGAVRNGGAGESGIVRTGPLHCPPMKRIVILISGRGSNMEAIVQACASEGWPAQVAAVIGNRPEAGGFAFAQARGIPTRLVDHKAFDGREAFDAALG